VSDTGLPSVGSDDTDFAENAIQRQWDRFAMNDLSVDPSPRLTTVPTSGNSTNSPISIRAFESLPAYDLSLARGDTYAKADSNDNATVSTDDPDDRGAPR